MAFKEVTSLDVDNVISLGGMNRKTGKKNPTSQEGYYLGSKQVESPKSKNGKAYIHVFQTPKGNQGVWGKTDLDRKMLSVTPGTMVRASFDKMVPSKNGEMYKFKVEIDPDNTIDVAASSTEISHSSPENSYNDYGSDEEETETEDSYEEEEIAQQTALSALERKARVEALLKNKKR